MATIYDMVVVAHDETTFNTQKDLIAEAGHSMLAGLKIKNYFKMICSGIRPGVVQTKANLVKASGTITLVSFVATDTITVNGLVFTCVASGATGPLQFNVGAGNDDTLTVVEIKNILNNHTTLDGMIVATSATTVVTLTALIPGEIGNALTIAISAHGSVSGSGRLTSGTNGDEERTHYYGSSS